ncbi:MAG: acetyl-CoA carboxylase biotin carboxyl carrier protein subunit [Deltaproteobacteria bacterium]|nr:acetyl-CoA carboxylase biotin carboxyl carrier protein subunit [Deltaproteobacteria bacterium]
MEYELKVNRDNIHVDVDAQEDRGLRASICRKIEENTDKDTDKNLYDVHYDIISDHRILMTVDENGHARQVNAYVSDGPEGKTIAINGRYYLVKDLETQRQRGGKGSMPDTPDLITPATPAVVVKIHVKVGDCVEKGQKIIAVSAMKMETTLCAPYDGKVLKINTAINERVAPGQILVEIEKSEADQADTSGKEID